MFGQDRVGALANGYLSFGGVGLSLFVESHDDDGRAIPASETCLVDEGFFSFL